MRLIDREYVRSLMPRRDPAGHKGTFGKVYLLGGSVGYTGAPMLCAGGAVAQRLRAGVPGRAGERVAVGGGEVLGRHAPSAAGAGRTAVARRRGGDTPPRRRLRRRGHGRRHGTGEESDLLLRRLLTLEKPLVLDADGINALEGHIDTLSRRPCATVLTPHDGELARIGGDMTAPRESSAAAFAAAHGVYLVRKGHRTVAAAPDGRLAVNTTGNDGMAKGGSGDILTGLLTGLLAQGMEPFDACCAAVWIHGRAGDMAAEEKGRRGMTPADMIEKPLCAERGGMTGKPF